VKITDGWKWLGKLSDVKSVRVVPQCWWGTIITYALNSVSEKCKHKPVRCCLLCEMKPVRIETSKVWLLKLTDGKASFKSKTEPEDVNIREIESAPWLSSVCIRFRWLLFWTASSWIWKNILDVHPAIFRCNKFYEWPLNAYHWTCNLCLQYFYSRSPNLLM
jgi:hypothetical protein